jgi:hypothetical protein
MIPDPSMLALAQDTAIRNRIDPALVCAVIEQESGWDSHAMRYEGAFRARYVAPLGLPPTEEIARSISWGVMQVMGQVAREHGFEGRFLSSLCDPTAGLAIGCIVLAAKIRAANPERSTAEELRTNAGCMSVCRTATLGCVTLGLGGATQTSTARVVDDDGKYRGALELWNGGANSDYASQVLARVEKYRRKTA